MNLLCKSSIDEIQLNARENLIHNGIELQLLADFSELSNMAIVNSLGKNLKQIKAVHAPLKLNAKEQDVCLDLAYIADEDYVLLNKTCDLANRIGCKSGKIIPIIIHASADISKDKITEIAVVLSLTLDKYSHIEILVENVPGDNDKPLEIGSAYALPVIIKFLKNYISNDRLGLVLDTCHLLMRQRIYKELGFKYDSIEDYFKAYSDNLRIIHLANIRNFGRDNDHAVAFTKDDRALLAEIMHMLIKYTDDNILVTIETREQDYLECTNYKTTRKEIDLYMNTNLKKLAIW